MSLQMGRESHCFVPEIEKQENVYHGLKQKKSRSSPGLLKFLTLLSYCL